MRKKVIITITIVVLILLGIIFFVYINGKTAFNKSEHELQTKVQAYIKKYPSVLPTEKHQSKSLDYKFLISKYIIDSIYDPLTKNECSDYSYVKIVKTEDNKYQYYVNLKCDLYKSNIDVTEPKFELSSGKIITAQLGSKYNDATIVKFKDNLDKKVDSNKVFINKNGLDMNKLGTYTVTYTVYDSSYNKSEQKQIVNVVQTIGSRVINDTDDSNYYKGDINNNYVWYSGFLWRMVYASNDYVRLITDDAIASIPYVMDDKEYVSEWLNSKILKNLNNYDKYLIKNNNICLLNINSHSDYLNYNCISKSENNYLGLLATYEYTPSLVDNSSYLSNTQYFFNGYFKDKNSNYFGVLGYNEDVKYAVPVSRVGGIRPVISMKSSINLVSGRGTKDEPYRISDDTSAKINAKINTRNIGEYVMFSGYKWRIQGQENNNTKLVLAEVLNKPNQQPSIVIDTTQYALSIKTSNHKNLLDYIKENVIRDINYTKLVENKWNIYDINYNETTQTYKIGDISGNYKSYIGLPEIYDIFSITLGNEAQVPVNGVLKDSPDVFYMLNKNNYIIKYDSSSFKVGIIDIKPVIMLKDNVIITKGSGFENDPYYID